MQETVIKCSECGRKLYTISQGTGKKYKSPLCSCRKCGKEYIDLRCHELAAEGMPKEAFGWTHFLILMVIGGLIVYRGIYLFGVRQIGTPDEVQWLMPLVITLLGAAILLASLYEIFIIKTGLKEKRMNKLMRQSEERLSDRGYAYKLKNMGYIIPDRYL